LRAVIPYLAIICAGIAWAIFVSHAPDQEAKHHVAHVYNQCLSPDTFWARLQCNPVDLFTALLALFSGILTVTTFIQIRYLRRADETARISADAATIAARAAVASEMPIVFLTDISLWDVPFPGTESGGGASVHGVPPKLTTVQVEFKNYGRTPARLIQLYVDNRIVKELPADPQYVLGRDLRSGSTIAAGGEQTLDAPYQFQISEAHQDAIAKEEAFFWVYGLLNYRDFLGNLHETRFCMRWFGVDPGVTSDTPEGFVEDGPSEYHRQT
jgi:hypothetical protein